MKLKKITALALGTAMVATALAGCGSSAKPAADTQAQAQAPAAEAPAAEKADEGPTVDNLEEEVTANTELEGTLRMYGPGLFTDVGPDGTTDIVTGISRPGYNVVVERWNELYPNVKLEIETVPWDNWKAAAQAAALSGELDIIIHGASLTAISEPLHEYYEQDPIAADSVGMIAMRKNAEIADLYDYVPYGATICVNPVLLVFDKEIFEHYGVDLPDYENWTLEEMLETAQKLTGTDPVTGAQTYGMSMIPASGANKNYIWAGRAMANECIEWGDTLATSTVNFNQEKSAEVLNYLTELSKCSSPDYIEGLDMANAYTTENQNAMMIIESAYGAYNTIRTAGLEEKYMFAALPKIVAGRYEGITSSHMGDWNMSICNTSENQDLAWEFLKFMVTDPVVQQWLLDTHSIPANKEAAAKLSEYMPADYANALGYIVGTSPLDFSASANDCYDSSDFGTFANDLTTVLNEMFQGNMEAEAALEFVQKNLDDYQATLAN